ncbi:MAG: DUF2846 domain-containing protein [Pseudomonadota bacterium]
MPVVDWFKSGVPTVVWLLAATLAVAGCLPEGAPFKRIEPAADTGTIYIYRDTGAIGHGLDLEIFANRESIARLQVGTYKALQLAPGEYRIMAEPHKTQGIVLSGIETSGIKGNTLLRLTVQPGEVYYLELEEGLGSLLVNDVDWKTAEPVLSRMRLAQDSPQ